ncbi:transposase [Streptomyces sp. NBC_00212]|uniref:transposase n=1 Tax=Streptomyces sp. NBC_00212 TaxID=2975684 RepID=UPI00386CEFAD
MHDALAASRSTLTSLSGLGTVLAAKILGHIGDVSRFPTRHHFASYTGSAPLDASSGKNVRHRLNTGGNRPLNSALLSRSGSSPRGRSLLVPRAPGKSALPLPGEVCGSVRLTAGEVWCPARGLPALPAHRSCLGPAWAGCPAGAPCGRGRAVRRRIRHRSAGAACMSVDRCGLGSAVGSGSAVPVSGSTEPRGHAVARGSVLFHFLDLPVQ